MAGWAMHRAGTGSGFGTEMKPRLAWSSPSLRRLSASPVAICTQVGHGCAAYIDICTHNFVLNYQLDTRQHAGSLTLESLQVVWTQMEGHMPGVMAPTGS